MKKKSKADKLPLDIRDIKTPRQLADIYLDDDAKLENFFIKHRRKFYKDLPEKDVPFKKENDAYNLRIVINMIETVRKKIPDGLVPADIKNDVYLALYDFAAAIQAFKTTMQFIRTHNKMFSMEKKKALNYIEKLCNNRAIAPRDKKYLREMEKSFLKGGDYSPLYFFDFLHDLGYTPGENIDATLLQSKLEGLYVDLNIRFPRNNPADLFLFQTLQLVVYDLLKEKNIKLHNKKRYDVENSDKYKDAEELTAQIINSYIQKVGMKGLPVLTEKSIDTTLNRNPA